MNEAHVLAEAGAWGLYLLGVLPYMVSMEDSFGI